MSENKGGINLGSVGGDLKANQNISESEVDKEVVSINVDSVKGNADVSQQISKSKVKSNLAFILIGIATLLFVFLGNYYSNNSNLENVNPSNEVIQENSNSPQLDSLKLDSI